MLSCLNSAIGSNGGQIHKYSKKMNAVMKNNLYMGVACEGAVSRPSAGADDGAGCTLALLLKSLLGLEAPCVLGVGV